MKLAQKVVLALAVGFILVIAIGPLWVHPEVMKTLEESKIAISNATDEMLLKNAENTAKIVAKSQGDALKTYIDKYSYQIKTIQDLSNDQFARALVTSTWYKEEYSFVIGIKNDGTILIVLHPNDNLILKTPQEVGIPDTSPALYELMKEAAQLNPGEYVSGWYEWKGRKKFGVFYMTDITLKDARDNQDVHLVIGTGLYADSYLRDVLKLKEGQNPSDILVKKIDKIDNTLHDSILVGVIIGAVILMVFVYIINTMVSVPIVNLANISNKIADGALDVSVPYQERDDEIGILAKAIERVRRSLEIAMKTLEELT